MAQRGFVHIYTGDGKGKTTAAIGLAVRARAHNLRVCYISFHKNPVKGRYGETKSLKRLGVDVFCRAKKHPLCDKNLNKDKLAKECRKALAFVKTLFKAKQYNVVILDEINICVRDGFLKEQEVLNLLQKKPANLELILTGRGATKKLIKAAGLVSYIKEVKHPFKQGVKARKGIEY